eukprot:TRINITY_DN2715_c0_g1_i3.p1 TRINITY_DN2715_c0_g1~~TRINITY_DN2715_c0_g1_i3.p1  ORF type:complete len:221 (-),score=23.17 TRINITY_DN2715_c0_g1_i3:32-694(-)
MHWTPQDEASFQTLCGLQPLLPEEVSQCLEQLRIRRPTSANSGQWGWSRNVHPLTRVEATVLTPVQPSAALSMPRFDLPGRAMGATNQCPEPPLNDRPFRKVFTPSQTVAKTRADSDVVRAARAAEHVQRAATIEAGACVAYKEATQMRAYAWTQLDRERHELARLVTASAQHKRSSQQRVDELTGMLQRALVERVCAGCLLYTSPSPRDRTRSRMPSSA